MKRVHLTDQVAISVKNRGQSAHILGFLKTWGVDTFFLLHPSWDAAGSGAFQVWHPSQNFIKAASTKDR